MTIALELKQLKKTYPGGVQALRGIDLQVEAGDFYALLGPNGAGKSTTIGIISSLVNKTSGQVNVFGYDLEKDVVNAKRQLGLVPQEFNFTRSKPCSRSSLTRRATTALSVKKPFPAVKSI
ncbi:multidrug ABC transporter [Klebsiella pneumoniae]|nr:multidrug ABC transporter [Klebsiella pneumoniae]